MKMSVDRIENDRAVLVADDGTEKAFPLAQFAFPVREGMLLSVGTRAIRRLKMEEAGRRVRLYNKLKKILKP